MDNELGRVHWIGVHLGFPVSQRLQSVQTLTHKVIYDPSSSRLLGIMVI